VLNDRLANDVRRNGTHSSGTDDDRSPQFDVDGFIHGLDWIELGRMTVTPFFISNHCGTVMLLFSDYDLCKLIYLTFNFYHD